MDLKQYERAKQIRDAIEYNRQRREVIEYAQSIKFIAEEVDTTLRFRLPDSTPDLTFKAVWKAAIDAIDQEIENLEAEFEKL